MRDFLELTDREIDFVSGAGNSCKSDPCQVIIKSCSTDVRSSCNSDPCSSGRSNCNDPCKPSKSSCNVAAPTAAARAG